MKVLLVETQKRVAVEDWMADEDGADTFLVSTGSGKSGGLLWAPVASLVQAGGGRVEAAALRAWLDAARGAPAARPRVRVSWTRRRFGGAVYRVKAGVLGSWRCCVAYDDGTIERGVKWNRISWDDDAAAARHEPWREVARAKRGRDGAPKVSGPSAKVSVEGGGAKIRSLLPVARRPHADDVADFFAFLHERQEVWRRRAAGEDAPWTGDALLRHYVFCNNYRELDRGTQYFRRCLASRDGSGFADVLWCALCYRLLNKLETFARDWNGKGGGIPRPRDWAAFEAYLRAAHADGPIFSNAHQTMGLDRYVATMRSVKANLEGLAGRLEAERSDAAACFAVLQSSCDNVGPFLAWQVVCDLTEAGAVTACEDSWAQLGPGAKRGLARCFGKVDAVDELDLAKLLASIHGAAFAKLGLDFCYLAGRRITVKNVEHCLCEYEKYRNDGAGMRRYVSRAHLDGNALCATCRDPTEAKDGELLLCDLCCVAVHATCLDPPLATLPTTPWWMCPACDARWAAEGGPAPPPAVAKRAHGTRSAGKA